MRDNVKRDEKRSETKSNPAWGERGRGSTQGEREGRRGREGGEGTVGIGEWKV